MDTQTKTKNVVVWSIIGLVVLGVGGYYLWDYLRLKTPEPAVKGDETTAVFTPSASVSADGNSATLETAINKGATAFDVTVTPLAVLEDSRCPKDVTCVQAGTVRVRVKISSNFGAGEYVLTLLTPQSTEAGIVELTAVAPEAQAGKVIVPSEYRFTFRIKKSDGFFEVKG